MGQETIVLVSTVGVPKILVFIILDICLCIISRTTRNINKGDIITKDLRR